MIKHFNIAVTEEEYNKVKKAQNKSNLPLDKLFINLVERYLLEDKK